MARMVMKVPIIRHLPFYYLSLNIDAHVTSQMLVRCVALEVSLPGVHVSLIVVIPVILNPIVSHCYLHARSVTAKITQSTRAHNESGMVAR